MLTVSDEIEAIIGYPAADFVDGSKLVAATHPDDRDPVMEQIDAAIDAGRHRAPCGERVNVGTLAQTGGFRR